MFFANIDPHTLQLHRHVAACSLTVVGQEQERMVLSFKSINEDICAGNQLTPFVDDTIHVDQKSKFIRHVHYLRGFEIQIDFTDNATTVPIRTAPRPLGSDFEPPIGDLETAGPIASLKLCFGLNRSVTNGKINS